MFFLNTQLASVAKSSIEFQLFNYSLLTNQACDLLQKMLLLNIAFAKASVQQVCTATSQLLSGSAAEPAAHLMAAGVVIAPKISAQIQTAKAVAMLKSVRINPES